ncbi:hypothetical protein [Palleronia pelagia]|uniref:DUF4177 domain-containing protein n=1 Tax=Palleronia pelagia TaxID=387096 RepID=A0A1H8K1W1_9RHOB|nr:hypothetical protein [Palleronia pelagia]SEN86912.1 hypothetical protein SAMN04488011_10758 [Palleronia pelagia]
MSYYEYRVVPARTDAPRVKGVKGVDARFALAMEESLNAEGLAGWEFQRSETLNVEARRGLLRKPTVSAVTVLVFRRWVETEQAPAAEVETAAPRRPDPVARNEPDTPEELATEISQAPYSRAPQGGRGLSASRKTEGDLHPVPGPDRS